MRSVLNNGSSGSEFVVYAEAGHAFYADYRSSHSKDAAKDAWKRCIAWFQANGVA
jgi:carboxymethylenebutenolidase